MLGLKIEGIEMRRTTQSKEGITNLNEKGEGGPCIPNKIVGKINLNF